MSRKELQPNGRCWCGCGASTKEGMFFLAGHDKVAESAVIACKYGSVAEFLVAHGYGPEGKNPRAELAREKGRRLLAWVNANRRMNKK